MLKFHRNLSEYQSQQDRLKLKCDSRDLSNISISFSLRLYNFLQRQKLVAASFNSPELFLWNDWGGSTTPCSEGSKLRKDYLKSLLLKMFGKQLH